MGLSSRIVFIPKERAEKPHSRIVRTSRVRIGSGPRAKQIGFSGENDNLSKEIESDPHFLSIMIITIYSKVFSFMFIIIRRLPLRNAFWL